MPLLEECKEHFGAEDLYEVFGLEKKATAAQVKKAYYKLSMINHPDKAGGSDEAKQEATVRFQLVSKVYEVLSDEEKRKIYDETGVVDEEGVLSDEDSVKLWRTVFKKVTKEDIEKFFANYKGSKDEEQDVINIYNKFEGNMTVMLEHIMTDGNDDESRIKEMIDRLIEEGVLKATKKYKSSISKAKTAARAKKAEKEAKDAQKELDRIAKENDGVNDLEALILKRQAGRQKNADSFFDSLAAKYAPKPKKGKK